MFGGIAAHALLTLGTSAGLNPDIAQPPPSREAVEGPDFPLPERGRTILIGEFHGTSEIPRLFAGLVRRTAAQRRVVVGLELPPSTRRLKCRPGGRLPESWRAETQDGRTSAAMRDLVCELRSLARSRRVRLVYLDDEGERGSDFDARAAARFHNAARRRPSAGLILAGSFHTRNANGTIAYHLRALGTEVDTVVVSAPRGAAWHCTDGGACGPTDVRLNFCSQRPPTAERVYWYAVRTQGAQWNYCLSVPRLTPSAPAAAAASASE
jgi:hypothetical protein